MAVTLFADVLRRYRRFTLYNSPYTAHDSGCAVDLYPGDPTGPDPEDGEPVDAPSPVAGRVVDVRTVTAPSQSYAASEDHLILVDVADQPELTAQIPDDPALTARILHVDPAVEPDEWVGVGDSLGTLVRAGFFAPWVANHLHLGFRARDADPYRAAGSLPLELDPALTVEPLSWDGTGTVVAAGESYAVLDAPAHPDPGDAFAGLAATDDRGDPVGVLDGGLPHYDGGGLLRSADVSPLADDSGSPVDNSESLASDPESLADAGGPISLLGTRVGTVDGRDVVWSDLEIRASGDPVTGLALAPSREGAGVEIVGRDVSLSTGERVRVELRRR